MKRVKIKTISPVRNAPARKAGPAHGTRPRKDIRSLACCAFLLGILAYGCASGKAITAVDDPKVNTRRATVQAMDVTETAKAMDETVEGEATPQPTAVATAVDDRGKDPASDGEKQVRKRAESWGEYYFRKGDFRRAVMHLREEVKQNPDSAELWRHLGSAYGMNNEFNNAIACYEAALRRNPKDLKSHYNLSLMHTFKGKLEDAEAAAKKGLSLFPGQPNLIASLGNIYADQKKEALAIQAYARVLKVRPKDTITRYNKAAMHYRLKQMGPAEEEYRKVLEITPNDLQAAGNLAAIYILQNRLKEAERLNRWVIKQGPQDENTLENAYFNLGIVYDRQNKLEKALNMYKLALQVAPWDASAYVNTAVILERLNRKGEALTYWKKYDRLFPASKRKAQIKRRIKILEQLVELEKAEKE